VLNAKGQRELAYVVRVDGVEPIAGRDRVECAHVGGWTCMVRKGTFKPNDLGIYFEIDSKVDANKPEFAFTEKYHGRIKTQKFTVRDAEGNKIGAFYSQGLLMSPSDFGWTTETCEDFCLAVVDEKGERHRAHCDSDGADDSFLTSKLGVTYNDPLDNIRKSTRTNPNAKYQRMMNRHPKLAKSHFGKWCMRHTILKKILYTLLGGDKKNAPKKWPKWVAKTDEERIQNCYSTVANLDTHWIGTEKRDGMSTTMTLKRGGKKFQYLVCSRNVVMNDRQEGVWYDTNVYTEMSAKYDIQEVLESLITNEMDFVTLQGEIFGEGIQKRDYGLREHVFEAFNLIFGYKDGRQVRLNPIEMKSVLEHYNVPTVPVILEDIDIRDMTCSEILDLAHGQAADYGGLREGIVFRSTDGTHSFKAVDNEFIMKFHD
jgi:hypothetical protein